VAEAEAAPPLPIVDDDASAAVRIALEQADADRLLNQEEVDRLLGFDISQLALRNSSGIRAIVESALVSHERLPTLEIVFDRLLRLLTTSLRNFTSQNVEVSLDRFTSVRFSDYLGGVHLPAMIGVVKAEEWDNHALLVLDADLIYAMIDVLLGGRHSFEAPRFDGRPYTAIETDLVRRLFELIAADAEQAFRPVTDVRLRLERIETNPRFAAISRPANAAILVRFRIDMQERGGIVEFLLPHATIEPIRDLLLQMFMGEKFGRDPIWEGHLATEVWSATVEVTAVLAEQKMPLRRVMRLGIGETLMLDARPDAPVQIRCGSHKVTEGRMGRSGEIVAVQVARPLNRSRTTMAIFEAGVARKEFS
jgi:flagellar motor switch protein FliM